VVFFSSFASQVWHPSYRSCALPRLNIADLGRVLQRHPGILLTKTSDSPPPRLGRQLQSWSERKMVQSGGVWITVLLMIGPQKIVIRSL
jgi:hypothetical protein